MKKKYKSKISYWLFVPVLLSLVYAFIMMVIEKDWFGCIIIFGLNLLVLDIVLKTYYQIEGSELKVILGFIIKKSIPINDIKKIAKTNSLLSSPALSLTDRIEIFYDKYDSIIISPMNQGEFISDLKSINYDIEISL